MKWYSACFGSQPGERRQHAECVAGEKDYVPRMSGDAGDLRVFDEFDRIRSAGVLGDAAVGVVDLAVVLVEDDVFEDAAETDGVEDLRLGFASEIDSLCVAASFDVEDPFVGPAVFVVADEQAVWIG